MSIHNKVIVSSFIEEIWNRNQFGKMNSYLHSGFTDHSLPPTLPPNREGMKLWIMGTCKAFENKTIVQDMVCEDNKVMVKIKMLMKHIGRWRDIDPTGKEIYAFGYRFFKLADDKIIDHWALIDGNAIESQLKQAESCL
jgi:predicted SnoaL-like aldol condensation-catalyzing enzyme